MIKHVLLLFFLLTAAGKLNASEHKIAEVYITLADSDTAFVQAIAVADTAQALPEKIQTGSRENVKLIAAILAFPFPFGMIGLHRIYLGTKPWVPIVYVCTLGGCFGVLPFIDFVVILLQDEESLKQYQNNDKVFMWVK
ncbi:MAG: TM2 domain-containing protein [Bacteroidota bacterium]|jgi:TM2 domain-containing membrane protein YozV